MLSALHGSMGDDVLSISSCESIHCRQITVCSALHAHCSSFVTILAHFAVLSGVYCLSVNKRHGLRMSIGQCCPNQGLVCSRCETQSVVWPRTHSQTNPADPAFLKTPSERAISPETSYVVCQANQILPLPYWLLEPALGHERRPKLSMSRQACF